MQASDTCTNCGYTETFDLVSNCEIHTCCTGTSGFHDDDCPEMFAGVKTYFNDTYYEGYQEGYKDGFEDGSQPKVEPISLGWMDIEPANMVFKGSHGSFYLRDGGFVPVDDATSVGTGNGDPSGPGSQSASAWSPNDLGWTGAPYHKGKEPEEREYDYADPWNHPSDGNPK